MRIAYRTMTEADLPAGMRLSGIAGWNQTPADWLRFLSGSPEGCFAAEAGDLVIGTSATIVYAEKVAWVSMVLVDPAYRGQGIGTELLHRAIAHLREREIPSIKLDATPLGKPIYEKSGFLVEYEVERWELRRPSPPADIPEPPRDTTHSGEADLAAILAADPEVFGADRGGLLRSLAETAPDLTLARRSDAELRGYALGRRGALADHLGPWIADGETTGASLLDDFLARTRRDRIFVDCLPATPWAVPLLVSRGFQISRPLTRMYLGTNRFAGHPARVGAIVGPEFG